MQRTHGDWKWHAYSRPEPIADWNRGDTDVGHRPRRKSTLRHSAGQLAIRRDIFAGDSKPVRIGPDG